MPEARDLLPSSYRMGTGLDPLHEDEEYNETADGKDSDRTEETVDDDYGFYSMDDDDYQSEEVEQDREQRNEESFEENNPTTDGQKPNEQQVRRRRKKSVLRKGSAYGAEQIPLDFERTEFNRVLPKPDLSQRASTATSLPKPIVRSGSRGLFRVNSEPIFVTPVYQGGDSYDEEDTSSNPVDQSEHSESSSFVEGAMKKRISFGTIQIREHVQTIGDNPSCSSGVPVQLDWDHTDMEELKLEDYEAYRTNPRRKDELHLNYFQRMNLLKLNGFSTNEIKESKKQVKKHRNQREWTKFVALNYPQLNDVEDAIESGVRKMKRTLSKSKLNKKNGKEDLPRKSSKDDLNIPGTEYPKSLVLDNMDNDNSNATAPF